MRRRYFVLALLLAVSACSASAQPIDEQPYSTERVELTTAEADSILDRMDDLEMHVELLKVDLWESRRLARADSSLAASQLVLQARAYETMVEAYRGERENWLERTVSHPMVWFALGVWVTSQTLQISN